MATLLSALPSSLQRNPQNETANARYNDLEEEKKLNELSEALLLLSGGFEPSLPISKMNKRKISLESQDENEKISLPALANEEHMSGSSSSDEELSNQDPNVNKRLRAFSPQTESKVQIHLPSIQLLGLNNPSSILTNERSLSPVSAPSSPAHPALSLSSSTNNIRDLIHHASFESSSITTTTLSPNALSTSSNNWVEKYNEVKRAISQPSLLQSDTGAWIAEQMKEYQRNGLSDERIELLKQIGIDLRQMVLSSKTIVSTNFANADGDASFSSALGKSTLSSPMSPSDSNLSPNSFGSKSKKVTALTPRKMKRNQLSSWMCTQRQDRKSGELPDYRIKLLDIIGFVWSKQNKNKVGSPDKHNALSVHPAIIDGKMSEKEILETPYVQSLTGRAKRNHELWLVRYHELIDFKRKHGHLKVPTLIPDDDENSS